jgi:hypothetical protein
VGRDRVQPRGEGLGAAEPVEVAEHLQPDILDAVRHLRRMQHNPIADAVDAVDVPVVQARGGVPIALLNRLDQGFIRNRFVPVHDFWNRDDGPGESAYREIAKL